MLRSIGIGLTVIAGCGGSPAPVADAPVASPDAELAGGEVRTLTSSLTGGDGLVRRADGDLLVGQPQQGTVKRVTLDGQVFDFAAGLVEPYGMSVDSAGTVFVADWGARAIKQILPDGAVSDFVSITGRPGNVFVDADDNVLIPYFYQGTLERVTPDGTREVIAQLPRDEGFHGLMYDAEGQLYAGMHLTGKLYKIHADGSYTPFAELGGQFGNMLFFAGRIFVTGYDHHRLYVVSSTGEVEPFAGTGTPGSSDGAALTAEFTNPNGLAGDPAGNVLYVSESRGVVRELPLR